ncbi:tRNA1(Val) (adenine(37)-N6)-methyltransferase [Paramixta manurensis]|uniref:tRNA1(Val) (adenine(37)-N6)-methyltransferase n=1 Tax=Paramixta manurensis TaxID=2740817 RepID=A0A6M8UIM8_9GAMM|nr:tRNA1(Val) (adenine(37)-N6)-methyltransferase [Erwiniaceae bacterium PD-1]
MSQHKGLLRADGFTFKQFFIAHDRCAMKVGTDGVLLGAWVPVARVTRALDIGTGSGLIAIMLAQRTGSDVHIDAVELDDSAALQAAENAAECPWAERISIHQQDIISWAQNREARYSLIVSNPPFFTPGTACSSPERAAARATHTLDHAALLGCAEALIDEEGFFCVILPEDAGNRFVEMAATRGWHLRFRNDIADNENRAPHRVMLGLSPQPGELLQERMVIRGPDQRYSEAYCGLTRDFYLFM